MKETSLGERKAQATPQTEDELWRLAFKKLVLWTVKRHRLNPDDAEETVQTAIQQFVGAGGVVDVTRPADLLAAIGSRINGIAVNLRRKKALLAVGLTADGMQAEPDDPPDAEDQIVRDDLARKAVDALLKGVEDDELLTAIVIHMAAGHEEPAELARVLGRDVHEVYNARRRLKLHVEAVEKKMEGW